MHSNRDTGAKAWLLRIFRPGIRQKVALVLVTTLVVTLSVGGWRALHNQRQDIIQETHLRGTELAHVIAQSLVNPVVGYDYHAVELTLRETVKGEDIVYAKVLSPRGNVMAEIGAVPANDENFVLFEQTIRLNTETVGRLFLGLSLERIAASLQQQRQEFAHQELAIILTIVLVEFLALSFLILRPIAAISRVMSQVRNDPETDVATGPETKPGSSASAPDDDPMALAGQLPSKNRDEIGDLARAFVRLQERTARAMNNLRRSEQKHRALVEAMPDAIFRLSRTGVFLDSKMPKNLAAAMLLPEVSGKFVGEAFPPDVAGTLLRHLQQAFESGKTQLFYYPQEINGKNLYFEARVTIGGEDEALVVVRDITEHRQMEEQIHTLAHYDSLTHLPNRLLFKERLRDALAQAQRQGKSVAVMAMDLDHFKFVNDTLGHDNGDLLLQGVAERLQRSLRTSDYLARPTTQEGKGAILSRPGGDEFTILLTQIGDENDAARAARRVLEALAAPFRLTGHEIGINTSLGIALSPSDGTDPDTLIKNADAAMHHAKGEGRNTYRFFTPEMNATFSRRLTLGNYLRKALERDELALHYQPQVEIASGRVVGVESLLRWNHPELGAISPVEFIPLAEDTGLIVPIGEWVLRTACAQTRAWQKNGLPALRVAVNLSGVQFRQPGLVAAVERALRESGLEPRFLELELTEGILLRHDENVLRTLKELKALGVQLSIDDFGTGYSSLSYLNRFPLDTLKIDRSFVRDIGARAGDDAGAIASAIIAMAHSLKLQVVAEGVETDAQLAFLRQRGCDIMQGFLYSPPVPTETLPAAARGLPPPRRRANARH